MLCGDDLKEKEKENTKEQKDTKEKEKVNKARMDNRKVTTINKTKEIKEDKNDRKEDTKDTRAKDTNIRYVTIVDDQDT